MAQPLYRYGIDKYTYDTLSSVFQEQWVKSGRKLPQTPEEKMRFDMEREQYISDMAAKLAPTKAVTMLRNLTGEAPRKDFTSQLKEAITRQKLQQMEHTVPNTPNITLPDYFQKRPIQQQQQPVVSTTQQSPLPVQQPQAESVQGRLSAQIPAVNTPNVAGPAITDQTNRILELINKNIITPQTTAAMGSYEALKSATENYEKNLGAPLSLLDFYRQQIAQLKRPDRDAITLSDVDKGNVLMSLGLGMLARNRKSFGEALGESGLEALSYAEKKREQRYADALAKYQEDLQRVTTETNLSATDYQNRVNALQKSYERLVGLINAKEKAVTAGVQGAGAQADILKEQLRQQVEWAKAQLQSATQLAGIKASLAAAAMRSGKQEEEGYTAKEYLARAASFNKMADALEEAMGTAEEMKRNKELAALYRARAIIEAERAARAAGLQPMPTTPQESKPKPKSSTGVTGNW